jgi:uncharacterized metal-binding protein
MDGRQMDQIAKTVATGGHRRWALKALAGGAVGVGMLVRGARSSEAIIVHLERCQQRCHTECESESGAARGSCMKDCQEDCRNAA